jgi:hypothetical protein
METVRVASGTGGTMTVETHPGEGAHGVTVAFPIGRVWAALRAAYDSVAVPVAIFEPATHTVGNAQLRLRRRLGEVALSKYINCGNTQGGSSADTYEVLLSVVSAARPGEVGKTDIMTTVTAEGRPITLSSAYTRCTTTGALEKRLVDLVMAQLSR